MGNLFGGGGAQNQAGELANAQMNGISQLLTQYFNTAAPQLASLANGGFQQYLSPQIQTLSNNLGSSNAGLAASFGDNAGGVANPNKLAENLATKGFDANAQATQGMGSTLGTQSLQAMLSSLGLIANPVQGSLNSLGQSAAGFSQAGQQQQAGNEALFGSLLNAGATAAGGGFNLGSLFGGSQSGSSNTLTAPWSGQGPAAVGSNQATVTYN
jgi:hypothetical protein